MFNQLLQSGRDSGSFTVHSKAWEEAFSSDNFQQLDRAVLHYGTLYGACHRDLLFGQGKSPCGISNLAKQVAVDNEVLLIYPGKTKEELIALGSIPISERGGLSPDDHRFADEVAILFTSGIIKVEDV